MEFHGSKNALITCIHAWIQAQELKTENSPYINGSHLLMVANDFVTQFSVLKSNSMSEYNNELYVTTEINLYFPRIPNLKQQDPLNG